MAYLLRDKNGILRAKLDNRLALEVINNSKGFFKEVKYNGRSGPVRVFELEEDFKVGVNMPMEVFFWKGERLIPSD